MKNICPVCGYNGLKEPPYDNHGCASFEVCACCGFEFGFDDLSEGLTFDEYKKNWINNGSKWFNESCKPMNSNLFE